MRRVGAVALVAVLLLLAVVPPSHAGGRGRSYNPGVRTRVFIGAGPAFWWGTPLWWGPPLWSYPSPAYVYSPPPVLVTPEPPIYIQQAPATGPLEPGYWYYCQSAEAYYPTAPACPEPWVQVAPRQD